MKNRNDEKKLFILTINLPHIRTIVEKRNDYYT